MRQVTRIASLAAIVLAISSTLVEGREDVNPSSAGDALPMVITSDEFIVECQNGYPESYPADDALYFCQEGWKQVVDTQPLVDALLGLMAERRDRALDLNKARALLPSVRDIQLKNDRANSRLAEGQLGHLLVRFSGDGSVQTIAFSWIGKGNDGWPYDVENAMKVRGIELTPIACRRQIYPDFDNNILVKPPGQPAFHMTVGRSVAGTGFEHQAYSVEVDVTGSPIDIAKRTELDCDPS